LQPARQYYFGKLDTILVSTQWKAGQQHRDSEKWLLKYHCRQSQIAWHIV